MFFCIIAYIVLTGVATFAVIDENLLKSNNTFEFATRIFFLITIGWFCALLSLIGALLLGGGLWFGEQTVGIEFSEQERLFVIPWAAKKVWGFKNKLFLR